MIWRKVKKVIVPMIIIKITIFLFFILSGDRISISRDKSYETSYQEGMTGDSAALRRQKLIRIVRNEEERGISIILRAKKNHKSVKERERDHSYPIVD